MLHPVEEGDDGAGARAREEARVLPREGDRLRDAARLLVQRQRLRHAVIPEMMVCRVVILFNSHFHSISSEDSNGDVHG